MFKGGSSYYSFKRLAPGGFNLGFIGSTCTALPRGGAQQQRARPPPGRECAPLRRAAEGASYVQERHDRHRAHGGGGGRHHQRRQAAQQRHRPWPRPNITEFPKHLGELEDSGKFGLFLGNLHTLRKVLPLFKRFQAIYRRFPAHFYRYLRNYTRNYRRPTGGSCRSTPRLAR